MHIDHNFNFKFEEKDCNSFLRYAYYIASSIQQKYTLENDIISNVSYAIKRSRLKNGIQMSYQGRLEAYIFYKYRDKKHLVMLYYIALGVTGRRPYSNINLDDVERTRDFRFDLFCTFMSADKNILLDDDFVGLCRLLRVAKIYEKIISEFEVFKLMHI
jgi:hypothetical protein